MVRSKKIEKMVEATASIMELASEKREVISPVLLVAKKRHRQGKDVSNIRKDNINNKTLT
ncbi:hypothetical protein SMU77_08703 [Streptococcus mutans NV1996]|nr:hypothetical protein SMU77_08703 [Streptococcus mutans NV1996]